MSQRSGSEPNRFAGYLTASTSDLLQRLTVVASELADAYEDKGFNAANEINSRSATYTSLDPSTPERYRENLSRAQAAPHASALAEANARIEALRVERDLLSLLYQQQRP